MSNTAQANIVVAQGEDFAFQILWVDSNGNPYRIKSPSRMVVKTNKGIEILKAESDVPSELQPDRASLVYSTSSGILQLHIPHNVTSELPPGKYFYDIVVTYDAELPLETTLGLHRGDRQAKLVAGFLTVAPTLTTLED